MNREMKKDYFEHIYLEYFKILSLFSLRIVGNTSSAEDIVQDVFAECWVKRKEIDISMPIKPYLYKLTYNRSLDFLKRSDNKNINLGDRITELDNFFFSTFTQDDQLHTQGISKEIQECVASLPEKCKQVFVLSRHHNLKNKEIAEKLGINIKTVEKHISKALQEIRTHLVNAGYLISGLIALFVLTPPLTIFNKHFPRFFPFESLSLRIIQVGKLLHVKQADDFYKIQHTTGRCKQNSHL